MCPLSNMGRSRPSTMCLWTQGTGQQTQAMRQCQWPMLPMRSCMLHRYSSIPLHCDLHNNVQCDLRWLRPMPVLPALGIMS